MRSLFCNTMEVRFTSLTKTITIVFPEGIFIIRNSDLLTGQNLPQSYNLDLLIWFAWFQSGVRAAIVICETCRTTHSKQDLTAAWLRDTEVILVRGLLSCERGLSSAQVYDLASLDVFPRFECGLGYRWVSSRPWNLEWTVRQVEIDIFSYILLKGFLLNN